jgi:hypothetical protein
MRIPGVSYLVLCIVRTHTLGLNNYLDCVVRLSVSFPAFFAGRDKCL